MKLIDWRLRALMFIYGLIRGWAGLIAVVRETFALQISSKGPLSATLGVCQTLRPSGEVQYPFVQPTDSFVILDSSAASAASGAQA